MRIYISVDMEGITGIGSKAQVTRDTLDYRDALALLHSDVNAAVEGAFGAGASTVLVNDAHDTMRNLSLTALDRRASLISGSGKVLSMVEGIEGADAAFFVGYHAKAGTPGAVLEHTYSARCLYRLEINGREVGETAMNAALAGHFGVPVVLVTGDVAAAVEAAADLPWAATVAVKEGLGPGAIRSRPLAAAAGAIQAAANPAAWAVAGKLFTFGGPVTFALELVTAGMAEAASRSPGALRAGPRRVEVTGADTVAAFAAFRAALSLAVAVS